MSESFVDLSYRGLSLGKRVKLTQVRPTTGYVEVPAPMPVGTPIGIATDDGVLIEALVAEVREQITGVEQIPGMVVKPKLEADAARSWWQERVTMPELEKSAPQADAGGRVTLVSRREAVPQLADDGRNTSQVTAVVDDEVPAAERLTNPGMPAMPESVDVPIVDDGRRTIAMDAVDLAALGLDPSTTGSIPVIADEEDSGPESTGGKKKKKRKR